MAQGSSMLSVVISDRLSLSQALASPLRPWLRLGDFLRQVYGDLFVGDAFEQMSDQIEPGAALVVAGNNVPGRVWRVGGLDHALIGRGVIPPSPNRFDIHRAQLPMLDWIVEPSLQAAPSLGLADIEKVLAQDDAVLHDNLPLYGGGYHQEPLGLLFRAEAHQPLDPGPLGQRGVEEDDPARRREMRDVALRIDLRLFAVGRRG